MDTTTTADGTTGDVTPTAPVTTPDTTTGLEVASNDSNILETKAIPKDEPKVEPKKDEVTDEVTPKKDDVKDVKDDKSKDDVTAPTMDELGYGDVSADQEALASLATDMGVSYEDLSNAVVDGKFDPSKLEGLTPRDSQLLKNSMDVELTRLANAKIAKRTELYNHAGGEENFKAMVEYTNKLVATDPAFKAEVTDMLSMMKIGGKSAELAVKSLFEKFTADPSTSLKAASEGSVDNTTKDTGLSRREKLDAGWKHVQAEMNK